MFKKSRLFEKAQRGSYSPYVMSFYDNSIIDMYGLTSDLCGVLDGIRVQSHSSYARAKKVYDLVHDSISYGDIKRNRGYAGAKEVWRNKEGVCGEMSYLYIAATRYLGLKSSYVSVSHDVAGKKVNHGCAAVWTPKMTLVDIAYHSFGIRHRKYTLLSDKAVLTNFINWQKSDN